MATELRLADGRPARAAPGRVPPGAQIRPQTPLKPGALLSITRVTLPRSLSSMKSLTFTRGVALAGALTLTHAAIALGATSHATTTHAAAHTATKPVESTAQLAQASGENAPLNLAHTTSTHAASSGGGASIVRTIVGLAIVIAVIYGIAWIMKQAKKSKVRPTGRGLSQ